MRRIENPSRETGVGPANGLTVSGFRFLPGIFDRLVTPLMRVGGLSRGQIAATAGNVWRPQPDGEATHGSWGRHWLRWVGFGGAVSAALAVSRGLGRTKSARAD